MSSPHLSLPFDPERDRAMFDRSDLERLRHRYRLTTEAELDSWDRHERRTELQYLGLSGVRGIRERYRAVRALKAAMGGRPLTDDELDLVVAPVPCKRLRRRLASRSVARSCSE
jgi:hypothetical protein